MKDHRPLLKKLYKKPPEGYRRLSLITILGSTLLKFFGDSNFGLWIEEMTLIHIESQFELVSDMKIASGIDLGDDRSIADRNVDVRFCPQQLGNVDSEAGFRIGVLD
jgi:hypothetical protein